VEKDTLYPERSMHYLGRPYARAWKSFFEMLVGENQEIQVTDLEFPAYGDRLWHASNR
jgi:hypothetical protein